MRPVAAAIAVHAVLAVPVLILGGAAVRNGDRPLTFELVRVVQAAPAPVAPAAAAVATAPVGLPVKAAPKRRRVAAPAPAPPLAAVAVAPAPAPDPGPAPPPPPPAPPPPPRRPAFRDDGFDQLTVLVQSWQHNDRVRACLEAKIGPGPRLDALRRGDHAAALRGPAAAGSFAAIYQRARTCLR